MSPLIVTHISTVHPAFDTRIFYKECRSLAAYGMKVNLVVTHDKEELIDNVKIIPLPQFNNRVARIVLKPFLAFSKALKTKADIFHFHDPELILIALLLKCLGKKVIYDVHEDVPSQILDKFWIPKCCRKTISCVFKGIEALSARYFDGIVTATPHIKEIFDCRNKNTVNINNYPLLEERAYRVPSEKQERVICYVGGITKERGIFEILKAIEGTNITLYLAGSISPKSLTDTLERLPGWKNVVYVGNVSRNEVYSILSAAHAGLCIFHPIKNHIYSLPNKIFEYMNAGIPLVASRFPAWEELLKDTDNALFIDPLNPAEIRKAMETLLSNPEKSREMGKRGQRAVKEKYNWENEQYKLINFYKNILKLVS